MKIYFIGAHSTGKTTLARTIAQNLQLPFLNEIARTILAEKELHLDSLRTNLDVVDQYQMEVYKRQMQEEEKFENFVSDRSFDNLAYMAQHARLLNQAINSSATKEYIDSLKKTNVVIFFVRPSRITMKNDGIRENLNWENVIAIDAMIKFMLEMWDLNYISINTDSMQERVKLVHSILSYVSSACIPKPLESSDVP